LSCGKKDEKKTSPLAFFFHIFVGFFFLTEKAEIWTRGKKIEEKAVLGRINGGGGGGAGDRRRGGHKFNFPSYIRV